jgi:hypothetical protein
MFYAGVEFILQNLRHLIVHITRENTLGLDGLELVIQISIMSKQICTNQLLMLKILFDRKNKGFSGREQTTFCLFGI